MKPHLLAIALLLLPLTACGDGEFDYSKLIPFGSGGSGGGGSYSAPAAPGYSNGQPLAPGVHKMLDDPEAHTDEWENDTFADSPSEAERNCEQQAINMTQNGGSLVRSLGARHVSGKLYKCRLSSEVPNAGN